MPQPKKIKNWSDFIMIAAAYMLLVANVTRLNLSSTAITYWTAFLTNWPILNNKCNDPVQKTGTLLKQRRTMKSDATKKFGKLQNGWAMQDDLEQSDIDTLDITVKSPPHKIAAPTVIPTIVVTKIQKGKLSFWAFDEENPENGLPEGVGHILVYLAISDTSAAPADSAYDGGTLVSRAKFSKLFTVAQKGKWAFVKGAFTNPKGEAGETGEPTSSPIV
jgi:hypothetical protein